MKFSKKVEFMYNRQLIKKSRRDFIYGSALALGGIALPHELFADINNREKHSFYDEEPDCTGKISVFSKNLPRMDFDRMASLVAEIGFDGIDLTVRDEGSILPENVERDLPAAVEAAKKNGIGICMITTGIVDADNKYTERILKTASALGIRHYRMGSRWYNKNKSIQQNLNDFGKSFKKLELLNRKYSIRGECQNHSGDGFGAAVWDLWMVLKDFNPRWIGSQYDIFHATVEGANSWKLEFELLKPYIGTIDIKDFLWQKTQGKWKFQPVPLGEGVVDYSTFITMLKNATKLGPFSLHYEYLPVNAELQRQKDILKKDLKLLKEWLA